MAPPLLGCNGPPATYPVRLRRTGNFVLALHCSCAFLLPGVNSSTGLFPGSGAPDLLKPQGQLLLLSAGGALCAVRPSPPCDRPFAFDAHGQKPLWFSWRRSAELWPNRNEERHPTPLDPAQIAGRCAGPCISPAISGPCHLFTLCLYNFAICMASVTSPSGPVVSGRAVFQAAPRLVLFADRLIYATPGSR